MYIIYEYRIEGGAFAALDLLCLVFVFLVFLSCYQFIGLLLQALVGLGFYLILHI